MCQAKKKKEEINNIIKNKPEVNNDNKINKGNNTTENIIIFLFPILFEILGEK